MNPIDNDRWVPDGKTTLMIWDLPRHLSQDTFFAALSSRIGDGRINFAYMPTDNLHGGNMGFAFVNCVNALAALEWYSILDASTVRFDHAQWRFRVRWAYVQGLAPNLAHYMGSAAPQEHQPIVIHGGQRIAFQDAVRLCLPPKPPRMNIQEKYKADAYPVVIMNWAHYLGPPGPSTSQILGTFSRFSDDFLGKERDPREDPLGSGRIP